MNNLGTIYTYLDFLYSNENFSKKEILEYVERFPKDKIKGLVEKHFQFSSYMTESLMKTQRESLRHKPQDTDVEVSNFYRKLNVHRSTYTSWKRMGYFKGEFGGEKKRKIPIEDINEFLNRFPKYKVLWEKQD